MHNKDLSQFYPKAIPGTNLGYPKDRTKEYMIASSIVVSAIETLSTPCLVFREAYAASMLIQIKYPCLTSYYIYNT